MENKQPDIDQQKERRKMQFRNFSGEPDIWIRNCFNFLPVLSYMQVERSCKLTIRTLAISCSSQKPNNELYICDRAEYKIVQFMYVNWLIRLKHAKFIGRKLVFVSLIRNVFLGMQINQQLTSIRTITGNSQGLQPRIIRSYT